METSGKKKARLRNHQLLDTIQSKNSTVTIGPLRKADRIHLEMSKMHL